MLNIPAEIKELLKSDSVHKNFRVHFPNNERADITNENIVSESVSFTESICSDNTLRFGVSDTPYVEFETFGVENIKNYTIECSLEIECPASVEGSEYKDDIQMYVYSIPYGVFKVESCKKQLDMSHRIIRAYSISALMSFPPMVKDSLDGMPFLFDYEETRLSYESIMKMATSNNRVWSQITHIETVNTFAVRNPNPLGSGDVEWSYVNDGKTYKIRMELKQFAIFYRVYAKDMTSNLFICKMNYTNEYFNGIDSIKDFLLGLGVDSDRIYLPSDMNIFTRRVAMYPSVGITTKKTFRFAHRVFIPMTEELIYPSYNYQVTLSQGGVDIEALLSSWFDVSADDIHTSSGVVIPRRFLYAYVPSLVELLCDDEVIMSAENNWDDEKDMINWDLSESLTDSESGLYFYPSTIQTESGGVSGVDYSSLFSANVKDFISSYYELQGKIGRIDRSGNITAISMQDMFENPVDTITSDDIKSFWYDDEMTKPIGRIICNYINQDNITERMTLDIVSDYDQDLYRSYDISDAYYIRQNKFDATQISDILNGMADYIKNISFLPLNMSMIGRPDIEAGDVVTLTKDNEEYVCFIEQRNLNGIQALTDDVTSVDEMQETNAPNYSYDAYSGILTIR